MLPARSSAHLCVGLVLCCPPLVPLVLPQPHVGKLRANRLHYRRHLPGEMQRRKVR
jgi:hypothetical protein